MTRKVGFARVLVLFLLLGFSAASPWRFTAASPQTVPENSRFASQRPWSPGLTNNPQPAPYFWDDSYPILKLQPQLIAVLVPPGFDIHNLFKTQLIPLEGSRIGPYPNLYPSSESHLFSQIQPLFLQSTNNIPENHPFISIYPHPFAPFVARSSAQLTSKDRGPPHQPFPGPYPQPFPPYEPRSFLPFELMSQKGRGKVPKSRPFPGPYPVPFPAPAPAPAPDHRSFVQLEPLPQQGPANRPFIGPYPHPFPPSQNQPQPLPLKGTENLPENRPFLGPYPGPFPSTGSPPFLHLEPLAKEETEGLQRLDADENGLPSKASYSHLEPNLDQDSPQYLGRLSQTETDLVSDSPLYPQTEPDTPSLFGAISDKNSEQSSNPFTSDELPKSFARVKHDDAIAETTLPRASEESPPSDVESDEMDPRVLIDTWKTPSCPDGQRRDHAGRCRVVSL